MSDLPKPTSGAERGKMVAWFKAGVAWADKDPLTADFLRYAPAVDAAAEFAIPPVEDMPELQESYGVMDRHGDTNRFESRAEAIGKAKEWDTKYSSVAPHRVVRLAVVEVVESPDSWERLAKDAVAWCHGLIAHGVRPNERDAESETLDAFTARRAALLARGSE